MCSTYPIGQPSPKVCQYFSTSSPQHIKTFTSFISEKLSSVSLPICNCCYYCSVVQSCLSLCNTIDCSMPDFLLHHHLLKFAQAHILWVDDAIRPSHPLLPHFPTFNHSQHQGLLKWFISSHQVVKVLKLQLQHQSFQWTFRTDFL